MVVESTTPQGETVVSSIEEITPSSHPHQPSGQNVSQSKPSKMAAPASSFSSPPFSHTHTQAAADPDSITTSTPTIATTRTMTTTTDNPESKESKQPQIHSAFTTNQKRFIVCMVSLASFFSPLSGQIYYPVMPTLVKAYDMTPTLINLSITTYMILQGLAPSFMGTFADTGGRRPAYILAFTIYTAANIGLALQSSYPALMVLRCLQSAGSSGTVSFGYGVIADIATPAERGTYIGPMAAGVMVAPALGPVIGGILSKFLGWRSVFWFLVIISGGYLVLYVITMPETARKIVGDGSVLPQEWWRKSVWQWRSIRLQRERRQNEGEPHGTSDNDAAHENPDTPNVRSKSKLSFPNPLKSFAILLEKDALILIIYIGLVMLSNIAVMTSTPSLFAELYGFNDLEIGLCFLPLGVSAILGSILNGKLLDYNYRIYAVRYNLPFSRSHATSLRNFPIEHARLRTFFPLSMLLVLAYLPYGWVLQRRAPLVAPLILQFLIGFTSIASLNSLNTLIVDLFPERPATAAAACNLVRCWLGAVGAAVIDSMLSGMGWGWCFTFLGLVMLVGLGVIWVEWVRGMEWREERAVKREKKEREKREKNGKGEQAV